MDFYDRRDEGRRHGPQYSPWPRLTRSYQVRIDGNLPGAHYPGVRTTPSFRKARIKRSQPFEIPAPTTDPTSETGYPSSN